MSLNVKKFVDIDIRHKVESTPNSIRDTAVFICAGQINLSDLVVNYNTYHGTSESASDYTDEHDFELKHPITSYEEYQAVFIPESQGYDHGTEEYPKAFFDNGGGKLVIYGNVQTSGFTTAVNSLPNELIVVTAEHSYATIKATAQTRNQDPTIYGVNRKLLLGSVSDATDTEYTEDLIAKYCPSKPEEVMSIAAYLTKIDVYGSNTVKDYCYTVENVTTIVDSDTLFDTLSAQNINFDIYLSNNIRAYGGNTKSGKDLVNEFMLIVLQQTVTDAVLVALTSKLKDEQALSTIKTVMSNELAKYITNGYLNTSAIWNSADYVVSYNGQSYTVVEQNTALPLGYRIKILPYSSLTVDDKLARKTPPIYIALSDSYGVRKVTINGKVF